MTINRYHFTVNWGGTSISFVEVSGLDIIMETIAVRGGSTPLDYETKVPGLLKFSDITLKRTIQLGDNEFYEWINTKAMGTIERRNVTISLLNENHEPKVVWKAKNCFPTAYFGPVLTSLDSQVATETLVLTHEGMTIEHL